MMEVYQLIPLTDWEEWQRTDTFVRKHHINDLYSINSNTNRLKYCESFYNKEHSPRK